MSYYQQFILIFILSTTYLNSASQVYPTNKEIADVIKKEVDNGRSNSIVVGIIDNGQESFICYGNPIEGKIQKADEKTIFEIASVTKVFVTTIFADLLLKKKLFLEDPIIKYLPDTIVFRDKRSKKITLRHLATHTSGFPGSFKRVVFDVKSYHKNLTYSDLFASLEKHKLKNNPGTTFKYSNISIALLTYIICKVTNRELESLIRERICEPFQMNNTTLSLTQVQEEYFATGYKKPGKPIDHWEFNATAGAGGLRSNAQDLITFLRKLFYENTPLKNAADLAVIPQFDSIGIPKTKIGLGWFITEGKNSLIVGHGGHTHGFYSLIMYDKLNNRGTVVLSNSSRDINDIGLYIFDRESKINESKKIKSQDMRNGLFDQIEGTYSLFIGDVRDTISVYKKDRQFFMYSGNAGEFEMFYQGKNSFLIPAVAKFKFKHFTKNKAQTITSIGKQEIYGKRIVPKKE